MSIYDEQRRAAEERSDGREWRLLSEISSHRETLERTGRCILIRPLILRDAPDAAELCEFFEGDRSLEYSCDSTLGFRLRVVGTDLEIELRQARSPGRTEWTAWWRQDDAPRRAAGTLREVLENVRRVAVGATKIPTRTDPTETRFGELRMTADELNDFKRSQEIIAAADPHRGLPQRLQHRVVGAVVFVARLETGEWVLAEPGDRPDDQPSVISRHPEIMSALGTMLLELSRRMSDDVQ